MLGETGDISNLCTYKWYEWCYFGENKDSFPLNIEILGLIVRPAKEEGNEMAQWQWVLKANGQVLPRHTARPLKVEEKHEPVESKKRSIFYDLIERKWGGGNEAT